MFAKRFFYVCAGLLYTVLQARIAQPQTIVGTAKFYSEGSAVIVVMNNGDFYRAALSSPPSPANWVFGGSFNAPIVGIARLPTITPEKVYAITPAGDVLWVTFSSGIGGSGNIFTLAGRPPGTMATLGSDGDSWLIATASNGDVFLAYASQMHLPNTVFYAGNIYGQPTPTQKESWGSVKARYR